MAKFWNHCFQISLIDFNGGGSEVNFGYKRFNYFCNFALFIVKNSFDVLMRLDFYCDSCFDPLYFLLIFRMVIFLFQLFIEPLNIVNFLFINFLICYLLF